LSGQWQLGLRELALEVNDLLHERDRDAVLAICWQVDLIVQQFAEVRQMWAAWTSGKSAR